MKKRMPWWICVPCFSGAANAEMFKCTKDGRTTFQEQPCGEQGGAETKMQSSKPSAWVGCYQSTGSGFDSGIKRTEGWEVRQEGNTLFLAPPKGDKEQTRMIMRPATPEDLLALKQKFLGPNFKGEVLSGLAMYGVEKNGSDVTRARADGAPRMGFYWISPATEEKGLYVFAPFAFDKTVKVPCAEKK